MIDIQHTFRLIKRWSAQIGDYAAAVAWSPDGLRLATASISGPVQVFARASGETGTAWPGHTLGTNTLAWHPDSNLLATGGQDDRVAIWSTNRDAPPAMWPAGGSWVSRVGWSPDGSALIWAADKSVHTCAWPRGNLVAPPAEFPATVADVAWSPDGNQIAATAHGGVWLWPPHRFADHRIFPWKGASHLMSWSPDARFIATADQDATVHFWFTDRGLDLRMAGYPRKISALAWDPHSRYLATASAHALPVWDCSGPTGPEGRPPLMLEGPEANVISLAYQRHGTWLAAGYQDGTLVIWEPGRTLDPLFHQRPAGIGAIVQLAWTPDDRCLAAATDQGDVTVYEIVRKNA
jgi:WD40 repeat protein